jgi:hypothetical protein
MGPGKHKSLAEWQREPTVEERILNNPAPRRMVREYDDNWDPSDPLVCDICHKEVEQLFPYGWLGKRKVCAECIARRRRLLEYKARVVAPRFRRPGRLL